MLLNGIVFSEIMYTDYTDFTDLRRKVFKLNPRSSVLSVESVYKKFSQQILNLLLAISQLEFVDLICKPEKLFSKSENSK